MKMLNLINERASDVVFHGTKAEFAYKILKDNQFQLSLVEPDSPDDHNDNKGNVYYLSTTRSTTSRYFIGAGINVIFKLDGAKLSQRYKAKSFNYFKTSGHFNWFEDEMEDRVINTEPTIDNASKYITEVHLYMVGSRRWESIGNIQRKIVLLCKKMDIPYYLYPSDERNSFFTLNTKNSASLSQFNYKKKKHGNYSDAEYEDISKEEMVARGFTYLYRAPYSERTLPDYAQYVLDRLRSVSPNTIRFAINNLKFTKSRLAGTLAKYVKKEGSYNDFKNFLIDKWKVKRNFPN